ncbi:hypothetical protein ZIOFF_073462 [Zingiber officinale]|uniref:Uncharacterized protein n=1 Tax=Zingiber officinale TaxID=94328 RepID=A0A8J5CSZ9_ZINOF|nr:hypothetical protein ZIOFF_073462 [Zingiber officinale]
MEDLPISLPPSPPTLSCGSGLLLCNEFGQTNEQSSPIPTVSIFMYNEVPDYILQDEVQAQDLLSLVQAEENNTVENYSNPEAPQQLPVLDERLGESFAEETMPYPIALETTRDPPLATAEEPVGEPTKRTYASIVCKSYFSVIFSYRLFLRRLMLFVSQLRAKGQSGPSMHPTLVIKTSLVVSEQAHSFSQHSHPAIFPENSGSEAIEEALVVEDEGVYQFNCFYILYVFTWNLSALVKRSLMFFMLSLNIKMPLVYKMHLRYTVVGVLSQSQADNPF